MGEAKGRECAGERSRGRGQGQVWRQAQARISTVLSMSEASAILQVSRLPCSVLDLTTALCQ